jgi:hypothetical protein
MTTEWRWKGLSILSVVVGMALVLYEGAVHSPNTDEVGHLPAGCLILEYGIFDLYKVNPPLVKSVAAIPVVLSAPKYDWSDFDASPGERSEWAVGNAMIRVNGFDSFRLFTLARWALVIFWLTGAFTVWRWARLLAGDASAFAAVTMWSFTPEVTGWTATICPDSAAASMGILCAWYLRKWLIDQRWRSAILAGAVLGLCWLTKSSWLILVVIIPLLVITTHRRVPGRSVMQCAMLFVTAIYVLNSGYAFNGSFQPLGEYRFFSRTLAGNDADGALRPRIASHAGNRFEDTILRSVPVPLPQSFVEGIDLQKWDFEDGKWSYLRGEHKFGGWWYWHAYAVAVKTPLGLLLVLGFCAAVDLRALVKHRRRVSTTCDRSGACPAQPQSELWECLLLLIPAASLFVLVSSQTGFSRYLRYVLPCYPFVFIYASRVFSAESVRTGWARPRWVRAGCWLALAWSTVAAIANSPHSISYFNEASGGPENGPSHLLGANIDWGQDVLLLSRWVAEHEPQPLFLAVYSQFNPTIANISYEAPPSNKAPEPGNNREGAVCAPVPGWYAVSMNYLYGPDDRFDYLRDKAPFCRIGHSIYVYDLTEHGHNSSPGSQQRHP